MRVLAALAILLFIGPAAAQSSLADDPEGDHGMMYGAAASPLPYNMLDLVSLALEEKPEAYVFTLGVQSLERETHEQGIFSSPEYYVYFEFGDVEYRIYSFRAATLSGNVNYFTWLQTYDAGFGTYTNVRSLEAVADLGTNTLAFAVDRDDIVGSDGSTPTKGTTMQGFWAQSVEEAAFKFGPTPEAVIYRGGDRMPDEGVSAAVWDVVYGLEQSGVARLASEQPYRISNGEATTFIYEVQAKNLGDDKTRFKFSAKNAPKDWVVTFPEEHLDIPSGKELDVPVLITVPFNHVHGTSKSLVIEMTSQIDPGSVGRLELGVRYTDVPQPAGHHDQMYLHAAEGADFSPVSGALPFFSPPATSYFNTLEDDDVDQGIPLEPWDVRCDGAATTFRFPISLSPGLAMGLDFDTTREGIIDFTVKTPLPLSQMTVHGELHRKIGPESFFFGGAQPQDPDAEETLLATLPATQPRDTTVDEAFAISLPIVPTEFSDYVPYTPEARLQLDIIVTDNTPNPFICLNGLDGAQPIIQPGGSFTLPLEEYHDDVDGYFQALSSVDLWSEGSQKRFVNPGATALFNVTAEHTGTQGGKFRLELTGGNVEWAKIVGKKTFDIQPGQSRTVHVAVTAPPGAADGELADVTLHAVSVDDPNVRTVLRMLTEVDVDAVHADATETIKVLDQATDKKSPGLPLAALVGLLVVIMHRKKT